MDAFQQRIGYWFRNDRLLELARLHGSYVSDNGLAPTHSNQRLEFLGDAVIGLIVSRCLYEAHPDWSEGRLTQARAGFVSTVALGRVGERLGLGDVLLLGRGEELTGGRCRESILADATEALAGAIYLDGGMEAAEAFVKAHVLRGREETGGHRKADPKTVLQERIQAIGGPTPSYELIESHGPSHAPTFVVAVRVRGRIEGRGTGSRKRLAEQAAAADALRRLNLDPGPPQQ